MSVPDVSKHVVGATYVGFVGSQGYAHLDYVRDTIISLPPCTCIVTGDAKGVDTYAYHVAKKQGTIPIRVHACWEAHGRGAGMRRNPVIVDISEVVLAFWDGKSPGTINSIGACVSSDTPCFVLLDEDTSSWEHATPALLEEWNG